MTTQSNELGNDAPAIVDAESESNMETIQLEEGQGTIEATDASSIEESVEEQSKQAFYTRLTVGLIFVAFVVFVIVDSATNMHALDALHDFLEWVEDNPVQGVFAFVIGK